MDLSFTPLHSLPISAISWGIGSIAVLVFGLKSINRYKSTANLLTLYFGWFGIITGLGLGLYGFPAFFTLHIPTLRTFYLVADLFVYAGLLAQVKVLWYLGFRRYRIFPYMALTVLIPSLLAWAHTIRYSTLFIEENIIKNIHQPFAYTIRGIIFAILLIPIGYFFLRKSSEQSSVRARMKSIALGLAYFLIGISVTLTELVGKGADSHTGMIINLIVFAIFLVGIAWPSGKQATEIQA